MTSQFDDIAEKSKEMQQTIALGRNASLTFKAKSDEMLAGVAAAKSTLDAPLRKAAAIRHGMDAMTGDATPAAAPKNIIKQKEIKKRKTFL